MTDNRQRLETQWRDHRTRGRRVLLLVFIPMFAWLWFQDTQRNCPLFTWDDLSGRIEKPILPDSPGLQLVGSVMRTRRYGMFHFGAPASHVRGVTVLYEDRRYFFVESTPEGFFQSLIDNSRFPHIAGEPFEKWDRHPIAASSASEAVNEAWNFLKNRAEPRD
jgi:hypothetical protein